MPIHKGLRRFFDPLVRATRWFGPRKPDSRTDSSGWYGDVNWEFTGDEGWVWHVSIQRDGVTFHRGGSFEPMATISMSPETFFRLLRGETSYMTARMTGQVKVRGDGYAGLMLGAVVSQFRSRGGGKGAEEFFARMWRRGVLSAIGASAQGAKS